MNEAAATKPPRELRDGNFLWIDTSVVDQLPTIGRAAFVVYCVLAKYADNKTQECYPSIRRMAKETQTSPRNVFRAITTLEAHKLIAVTRGYKDSGSHAVNTYRLLSVPPNDLVTPGKHPSDTRETGVVTPGKQGVASGTTELDSLNQTQLNQTQLNHQSMPAEAGEPVELLRLIDLWNGLPETIVKPGNGAKRDPPSNANRTAYNRLKRDPELREAFLDPSRLFAAIPDNAYCHRKGWFTFAWLFGRNKNGELNADNLLKRNRGHENNGHQRNRTPAGAGQLFSGQPSCEKTL